MVVMLVIHQEVRGTYSGDGDQLVDQGSLILF
jgi:hypothetical protein